MSAFALELTFLPGTPVAVCSDKHLCAGIEDPVAECLSGETAENDCVDSADSCACKHCNGKLPDHGKINGNPVALAHAFFLQDVCKLGYQCQHFFVGKLHYIVFRLALKQDGNFVAFPFFYLGIKAVVGNICFAADEPF